MDAHSRGGQGNASILMRSSSPTDPKPFDDPLTNAFVCTTAAQYERVLGISSAKYISRRAPHLYPRSFWAWSSLRNCIVCLLKLGFLAQAHCVCLVTKTRLQKANGKDSPVWMNLTCYETICHYEAGQEQTATGLFGHLVSRMTTLPADFGVLVRYRAERSIRYLVLRDAGDPWHGEPVAHYDQAVGLEGEDMADYLRTVGEAVQSNDETKWRVAGQILGSHKSCNSYRLRDPLRALAVISGGGSVESQPSAPDLCSIGPRTSTLDLGRTLGDLIPLTALGPDPRRRTSEDALCRGRGRPGNGGARRHGGGRRRPWVPGWKQDGERKQQQNSLRL